MIRHSISVLSQTAGKTLGLNSQLRQGAEPLFPPAVTAIRTAFAFLLHLLTSLSLFIKELQHHRGNVCLWKVWLST